MPRGHQPAWEGKGWKAMGEQRVRDNLEDVDVFKSMALGRIQAGKAG